MKDSDKKWFSIGPEQISAPKADARDNYPGTVFAAGPEFRVRRIGAEYQLFYLNGAQGGGELTLPIPEADALGLRSGEQTLDEVVIRHRG